MNHKFAVIMKKSSNQSQRRWKPLNSNLLSILRAMTCIAYFSVAFALHAQSLAHRFSFNGQLGEKNVTDSGGGPDGTLIGGADFTGDGTVNLDGISGYVDLPNGVLSSSPEVTIEGWFQLNNSSGLTTILDFGSTDGGEGNPGNVIDEFYFINDDQFGVESGITKDGVFHTSVIGPPLNPNTASHIAVTWGFADGGSKEFSMFVNGQKVDSATTDLSPNDLNDVNDWLGRSQWGSAESFEGSFDEFRVFDYALNDEEVAASYGAGPDALPGGGGPEDHTAPEVTEASGAPEMNRVSVTFSEPVDSESATDPQNYTLRNLVTLEDVAIDHVEIAPDGQSVTLFASVPLPEATRFSVGVVNVTDLAGNIILPPACSEGDFNGDGFVDAADLNILGTNWRKAVATCAQGDANGDGTVDAIDLNIVGLNWQRAVGTAATEFVTYSESPLAPIYTGLDINIVLSPETLKVDAANGVLSNDFTTEGNLFVTSWDSSLCDCQVEISSDGSYQYTPDPATDLGRLDIIKYNVSNGQTLMSGALAIDVSSDVVPSPSSGATYLANQDIADTPYTVISFGDGVPPEMIIDPLNGRYLYLTQDGINDQRKGVITDSTSESENPGNEVWIKFDVKMGGEGESADGFGVSMPATSVFGTSGSGPDPYSTEAEEPNYVGSLGFGFDVFFNDHLGDPGKYGFSVHWNGFKLVDVPMLEGVIPDDNQWHAVEIVLDETEAGVTVFASIDEMPLLSEHLLISELTSLYPHRYQILARTGGLDMDSCIRNFEAGNVQPQTDTPATLIHQYLFTQDANDSIGGADGTVYGDAPFVNGQICLPGGDPGAYVNLPNGIISPLASASLEMWVTVKSNQNQWSRLFDFGNSNLGEDMSGEGTTYLFMTPNAGGSGQGRTTISGDGTGIPGESPIVDLPGPFPVGEQVHLVVTYGPSTMNAYVNGNLVSSGATVYPLSSIDDVNNWLGRSQFGVDAYLYADINEFNIYSGELTDEEVQTHYEQGPVPDGPAVLRHQYFFTQDATDSVGGAHGTVYGDALFVTGQLCLPGEDNSGDPGAYVDLPNGIISSLPSASFEAWVTVNNNENAWTRIFDFGNSTVGEDGAGDGIFYMFLTPSGNGTGYARVTIGPDKDGENPILDAPIPFPVGEEVHVVVTYSQYEIKLYINGNLVASAETVYPLSILQDVNVWLGRSNYAADAYLNACFNEFRIYEGVLTDEQVMENFKTGPTDTTEPEIELVGGSPLQLECGTPYEEPGAKVTDNQDPEPVLMISGEVNSTKPGEYSIQYTATDKSGNERTVTRTVVVVDTTKPELKLIGNSPQIVEGGTAYQEMGATAEDSCDGNLDNSITIDSSNVDVSKVGVYQVIYKVKDDAGNESEVTREVDVVDTTAPMIACPSDGSLRASQPGGTYVTWKVTATDAVDPDVTVTCTPSPGSFFEVGHHTVTCVAEDDAGNKAECSFVVTVLPHTQTFTYLPTREDNLFEAVFGRNTKTAVWDFELAEMIDKYFEDGSRGDGRVDSNILIVGTECYAGNLFDNFNENQGEVGQTDPQFDTVSFSNTTVLSAQDPGLTAVYFGYHQAAAPALESGVTVWDVHGAGIRGKDPYERPSHIGDLDRIVGGTTSTHVLVWAGQPGSPDWRDLVFVNRNFKDMGPNVDVSVLAGSGILPNSYLPGLELAGPATAEALEEQLRQIGEKMDDGADEQFIFFIADHGGIYHTDPPEKKVAKAGGSKSSTISFPESLQNDVIETEGNLPRIEIFSQTDPVSIGINLDEISVELNSHPLGTLTDAGISEDFLMIPDEAPGTIFTLPFDEAALDVSSDNQEVVVINDSTIDWEYSMVSMGTGSIPKTTVEGQFETLGNARLAEDVQIGNGVVLYDNVNLHSFAQIGANSVLFENVIVKKGASIGPNCVLYAESQVDKDSRLLADVEVGERSILEKEVVVRQETVIGADSIVGVSSDIGRRNLIGNFVEVGAGVVTGSDVIIDDGVIVPDGMTIPDGQHIVP